MTVKKATAAGARRVTANLDNLANLFQNHAEALGVPKKVAMDFAFRCDLLSDAIEKTAGFDAASIGKVVPGPVEMDSNNAFMKGEFTQEENEQLSQKQESGTLAQGDKLASLIAREATRIAHEIIAKGKPFPGAAAPFGSKDDDAKDDDAKDESKKEAKKAEEDEDEKGEADAEAAKKSASMFGLYSAK